ncbi:MAG: hypothetical protein ACLUIQ_11545 [Dialister invisus]
MWAPSPKNRQPWKMIAALGKSKEIMLSLMKEGIDRAEEERNHYRIQRVYRQCKVHDEMHGRRACHRFYHPSRREKSPGRLGAAEKSMN